MWEVQFKWNFFFSLLFLNYLDKPIPIRALNLNSDLNYNSNGAVKNIEELNSVKPGGNPNPETVSNNPNETQWDIQLPGETWVVAKGISHWEPSGHWENVQVCPPETIVTGHSFKYLPKIGVFGITLICSGQYGPDEGEKEHNSTDVNVLRISSKDEPGLNRTKGLWSPVWRGSRSTFAKGYSFVRLEMNGRRWIGNHEITYPNISLMEIPSKLGQNFSRAGSQCPEVHAICGLTAMMDKSGIGILTAFGFKCCHHFIPEETVVTTTTTETPTTPMTTHRPIEQTTTSQTPRVPTTSRTMTTTTTERGEAGLVFPAGAAGSAISGVGAAGSLIALAGGAVGSAFALAGGAVGSLIAGVGTVFGTGGGGGQSRDPGNQKEDSFTTTTEIASTTEKEDDCSEEEITDSREDDRNEDQFKGQPEKGGNEDSSTEDGNVKRDIIYPKCSCSADSTNETTTSTTTTTSAPTTSSNKNCNKRKHGPRNSKTQPKSEPQEETCPLCKCPARYPVCFYTGKQFQGQIALATSLPGFLNCWPIVLKEGVGSLRLNENCVQIYSKKDCTGLSSVISQDNDADRSVPDKNKQSLTMSAIPFQSRSLSFSRCTRKELDGITNCGWKMKEGGATRDKLRTVSSRLGRSKRAIEHYSCSLGGNRAPPQEFPVRHLDLTEVEPQSHWAIDHVTGQRQLLHTVWYQQRQIRHSLDQTLYNRVEWFRVQYHWVPELIEQNGKWNPVHENSLCAGRKKISTRVYRDLGLQKVGRNYRSRSANRLNPHNMQAGHIVPDRMCGSGKHSFNFYPQVDGFNIAWGRVEEKLHKLIRDDIDSGGRRGAKWVEFSFSYKNNLTNVPEGFWFDLRDAEPHLGQASQEVRLFSDYMEAIRLGMADIFKEPGRGTGFYYNIELLRGITDFTSAELDRE